MIRGSGSERTCLFNLLHTTLCPMTRDELIALLSDRPGCCAGLRAAATTEIDGLVRRVAELESAISGNHRIIHQQTHEISTLKQLCRALRDVNVDLDERIVRVGQSYEKSDEKG